MEEKEIKTPEYTRAAIKRYQDKHDRSNINFPKGTIQRIKAQGKSVNGLVNELVADWLDKQESNQDFPF